MASMICGCRRAHYCPITLRSDQPTLTAIGINRAFLGDSPQVAVECCAPDCGAPLVFLVYGAVLGTTPRDVLCFAPEIRDRPGRTPTCDLPKLGPPDRSRLHGKTARPAHMRPGQAGPDPAEWLYSPEVYVYCPRCGTGQHVELVDLWAPTANPADALTE
jgi:hypothetical protein